ncbi:hypothetical protein MKS88_000626 [Plasmodium brasilianum]|uniref:Uncharacterized protein n=1 Tax=Plasmodium brasilianum TaxID=5824 RepID=A0ACB9YFA8_PLABR|nr:hypothetical protein MKS88_000626 [Plasmodium brasilianum]
MERNIKLQFFIKIAVFILLSWTCYLKDDARTFNKYLDEDFYLGSNLNIRNYRLLTSYKYNMDSTIVLLKDLLNDEEYEKKYIFNNEECCSSKNKQSHRSLLMKEEFDAEDMDYNYDISDENYSYF